IGHRKYSGPDTKGFGEFCVGVSQAYAVGQQAGALEPDREVSVTEVEPDLQAELSQPVHNRERVSPEAPAAVIDPVREPERDQVGVGRNVGAVDLEVVAGVSDH